MPSLFRRKQTTTTQVDEGAQNQLSEDVSTAVAKWLDENLATPARKYREVIAGDADWLHFRRMYDVDQMDGETQASEDYDPVTINMIMPTIDTAKGIALLTPPSPQFVPPTGDTEDEEFCDVLTDVIAEYLWYARKSRYKLGRAWTDAAIVGTAFAKVYWNDRLMDGDGDVDWCVVPAEEVFLDPATVDDEYGYLLHESRRPVFEIKYDETHYNDFRLNVQSDDAPSAGQKDSTAEQWVGLVTLKEYWVRGYHLKALAAEVPEYASRIDERGNKWGMVITVADGYVIADKPHPWMSDRIPFPKYVYYAGQGNQSLYGKGEVYFLDDAQTLFNAKITQIGHMAALIANKQRLVSEGMLVNEEENTSKPGQVIHVLGPVEAAFKELDPGSIPPSLFNFANLIMRFFEIIPGMYQSNRGETISSLRSGAAIQALQRGGEGRTAQKTFNFDDFVADIALCMADVMAVMYDEERIIRVSGVKATSPMDMVGSAMAGQMPAPGALSGATGARTVQLDPSRFWKQGGPDSPDAKRAPLDARPRIGMFFRSIEEMYNYYGSMMQSGLFDAQYVIEHLPIPDKQKLLQRLFAVQAMQGGAGQQGQGQPAAAPATPPQEAEPETYQPTADEANQMAQTVDTLMNQIQQYVDQGIIPQSIMDRIQTSLAQEQTAGGDGSQTMELAQQLIEKAMNGEQEAGVA